MAPAVLGGVAALATVSIWHQLKQRQAEQSFAASLIIAALIYVGFALVWANSADALWLELGGVLIYTAFAGLGLCYSPWFLALGWLAHVGWDLGLHGTGTHYVPNWYPLLCLIYDVIVSLYIGFRYLIAQRSS